MLQRRKNNDEALLGMLIFGMTLFMLTMFRGDSAMHHSGKYAPVISGSGIRGADQAVMRSLPEVPDLNPEHRVTGLPVPLTPVTNELHTKVFSRSVKVDFKCVSNSRQGQSLFIDRILVALHPASLPASDNLSIS